MLYTVHTSFTARDEDNGFLRRYCQTDKIEAPDKDAAKFIAWKQIRDSGEYKFLTFDSQNARASHKAAQNINTFI